MHSNERGSLQVVGIVILLLILVGIGVFSGILAGYLKNAPSVEDVDIESHRSLPTVIYDAGGQVLTRLMVENRAWVPLSSVPSDLVNAIVAVEDHTFYDHHGISLRRIAGALWHDLKHMSPDQGGSTITAQLARNVFLSQEKTIDRKIWEALYAFQLERRYTKDEILEYYLNWIYMGHGVYGVEAASQLYFGKPVTELSLGQCALIAGLAKGGEVYSPYKNMEAALQRRQIVLKRMADVGYISPEEASIAADEPVKLVGLKESGNTVGKYVRYMVRDYLTGKYGKDAVYRGGLTVKTTIDLKAQQAAEQAFTSLLPTGRIEEREGYSLTYPQCALVAIDPQTGAIRALVGGRGEDEYNRATKAMRSPGSSMKPFVYTAAIDSGYTPATTMVDEPISYPMGDGSMWSPKNYNGKYNGVMTLRQALEQSTNTIAVKLAKELGPETVIHYAKKMGITSLVERGAKNDKGLALALGGLTQGITPIEMAQAYSVLANGGVKVTPYLVTEVRDANGVVLESHGPNREIVLDERTAYIMADMMKGVITSPNGTGKRADIGRPAAGKTGTADSNTDAWFVGFTPDLAAAVWIGEDTLREMRYPNYGVVGSGKAAEIWGSFMKQALAGTAPRDFTVPEGIISGVRVCKVSGDLATSNCPSGSVIYEKFIAGTEPTRSCRVHGGYAKPKTEPESEPRLENDPFDQVQAVPQTPPYTDSEASPQIEYSDSQTPPWEQ
ncbi:MAG TPA: PBP1A family penicillin-binding protein [Bacillota bacterium]|jgi:penicillin-binding protein 1A|nr:PBP1A family penicillin-binding protein [Bacillota bacterium]HOK71193.1 PBP1A family penicillin-binding protein [Bacillota bacterium]HOL52262.1 PBP1A family penicillin-binding protein [Bacillota bacterium]HOO31336.1 PBP1A family penicillin-binding protein [Bacillota bacterium]HPZ14742.1 PBP1A family penicillin-binding protein [Bacillota bacterium]